MHHSAPASRLKWTLLISALLAAGAIVNIAVAWTCVLWQARDGYDRGVIHWGNMGRIIERHDLGDLARAIGPIWPSEPLNDHLAFMWIYEERAAGVTVSMVHCFSREIGTICRAGWPFASLHCCWDEDHSRWWGGIDVESIPERFRRPPDPWISSIASHVALPLRPEPLGFAANTGLYAAALACPVLAGGAWRKARGTVRSKRGRCPKCAYDMSGLPTGAVCPECGGGKGTNLKVISSSAPSMNP